MTRARLRSVAGAVVAMALCTSMAFAQTPPPANKQQPLTGRGQRGGAARVGRPALPPITPNMNQQQLQAYIDAYALVQAERELQLTDDQFPDFVRRLHRLQDVRRRHQMERRRIMGELNGVLQGGAQGGKDDAILERLRALDDVAQRALGEVGKAYAELDGVLTPWQRGRFRFFEEQLERRKIELLSKIGAGG